MRWLTGLDVFRHSGARRLYPLALECTPPKAVGGGRAGGAIRSQHLSHPGPGHPLYLRSNLAGLTGLAGLGWAAQGSHL